MHESVERVDALRFPLQFLLWAMRQWTHCGQEANGTALIREAFVRLHMPEAPPALTMLLRALLATTSRPLCWRCPNAIGVSADEWRVLEAVALVQTGADDRAQARLAELWPSDTVRVALQAAHILASSLLEAGLILDVKAFPASIGRCVMGSNCLH